MVFGYESVIRLNFKICTLINHQKFTRFETALYTTHFRSIFDPDEIIAMDKVYNLLHNIYICFRF